MNIVTLLDIQKFDVEEASSCSPEGNVWCVVVRRWDSPPSLRPLYVVFPRSKGGAYRAGKSSSARFTNSTRILIGLGSYMILLEQLSSGLLVRNRCCEFGRPGTGGRPEKGPNAYGAHAKNLHPPRCRFFANIGRCPAGFCRADSRGCLHRYSATASELMCPSARSVNSESVFSSCSRIHSSSRETFFSPRS